MLKKQTIWFKRASLSSDLSVNRILLSCCTAVAQFTKHRFPLCQSFTIKPHSPITIYHPSPPESRTYRAQSFCTLTKLTRLRFYNQDSKLIGTLMKSFENLFTMCQLITKGGGLEIEKGISDK